MRSNKDKAADFAAEAVCRAAFHNRKGHGGSVDITRRVLSREQLKRMLYAAINRSRDAENYFDGLDAGCEPMTISDFVKVIQS
jgi:hypothetical protein